MPPFFGRSSTISRSAIGQVRTLPESDYRGDSLFDLTAGVYNLFDKTVDYSSYGTVLDGRRYNLGVTYNF
ncbi:TonB-dependent receptor [Aeromonas allosaccharophila]|uniref:TonB-dependent receptor n=1 Tax=Aeromonas allosaccharophila TaxID=656 RepID=A0A7T2PJK7_9GAMM|nr:TonB-dependent receptor [Aeromonas allosaccharophila]